MKLLYSLSSAWLVFNLVNSAPSEDKVAKTSYSSGPQCMDKTERKCKKIPKTEQREECHEEQSEVLDTEYVEECEDVITTRCEEFSQQVHDSYHIGYSGYGQVLLQNRPGQIYSTVPKCEEIISKQCKKVPKEKSQTIPHKVCNTVVDTTIIEECQDIITTNCFEIHKHLEREVRVTGTDSYLVPPGEEYQEKTGLQ
eukprot:TRINITY_DN4641_c0_g1_i1.p1 TRINITY_DN4641_c0_g1~~TRINITY_DN4641_c0_g1_i1.p1  ORF type:complete len:230 (+),score=54.26 TRINITY_DN4641_c0_g1_i1:101-691(+)